MSTLESECASAWRFNTEVQMFDPSSRASESVSRSPSHPRSLPISSWAEPTADVVHSIYCPLYTYYTLEIKEPRLALLVSPVLLKLQVS